MSNSQDIIETPSGPDTWPDVNNAPPETEFLVPFEPTEVEKLQIEVQVVERDMLTLRRLQEDLEMRRRRLLKQIAVLEKLEEDLGYFEGGNPFSVNPHNYDGSLSSENYKLKL